MLESNHHCLSVDDVTFGLRKVRFREVEYLLKVTQHTALRTLNQGL